MRHAHSEHNELGIFNGTPQNRDKYGITTAGEAEIRAISVGLNSSLKNLDKPLLIVHSDFRRARETAEVLLSCLESDQIRVEQRSELRERDPGRLEGLPYREILSKLGFSPQEEGKTIHTRSGLKRSLNLMHRINIFALPGQHLLKMEPVRQVESRVTSLIRELHYRQKERPQQVLYIGHEFCLGPALNAFLARPAGMFWSNRHIPRCRPFDLSIEAAREHFLLKDKFKK